MLSRAVPVLFATAVVGTRPPNSFSNYPGYTGDAVTGSFTVHNAGSRLHISWAGLTGIDAACANGHTAAANSCGIHVHGGTSCADASLVGGHYYDSAVVPSDPWTTVRYSTNLGQVFVNAGYDKVGVHGRTMVIHAADGSRIGCSTIDMSEPTGTGGSGDGDGDGNGVAAPYSGPELPCLNPSSCQCPCGWQIGTPGATCRGSPGSDCMDRSNPNIVGPHMMQTTLEECKAGCEKTPGCVAVDHATHGDQRCWYYSACPSPNYAHSATKGPNAAYWGHRTMCAAAGGCAKTNAPASGLASLVGATACGSTITHVVSTEPNKYVLTFTTPTGGCGALTGCTDTISTLVETAANVLSHQIGVSYDSCTDKRKAQALSGTATVTITITNPQPASVSGDPFVTYGGKSTQIYLPVAQETYLLKCNQVELFGRVMDNGVAINDQWFDMFKLNFKGEEVVSVKVNSNSNGGVNNTMDTPVVEAKQRIADLLKKMHTENTDPALLVAKNLTSIDVNVMSRPFLTTGGPITTGPKVRIEQDAAKRIGQAFSESVMVETEDLSVKITSSVANKYVHANGKLAVHLDMEFPRVHGKACSGPLSEVWGLHPLSRSTAKLLVPPKKD